MILHTPDYLIAYGTSGAPVPIPCEQLGLDPVSIRRANLDVDVLELEQHRVRGAWAAELSHDTAVRFYRRDPETGDLRQLFCGRVVAPMEAIDEHARRRVVRVHNVMQLYRESLFQRGRWVPFFFRRSDQIWRNSSAYPFFPVDDDPDLSGHECKLFEGYNFFAWPYGTGSYAGHDVAQLVRQSVLRAVREWQHHVIFLHRRNNVTLGPGAGPNDLPFPLIPDGLEHTWHADVRIGDLGQAIWPTPAEQRELNYLDWLIAITKPLPDFCTWVDYAGGMNPVLRLVRFASAAPVDLSDGGWPVISMHVARQINEEIAALFIINQSEVTSGPMRPRVIRSHYPLPPPARNPLDRRSLLEDFGEPLGWTPPNYQDQLAEQLGSIVTAPALSGTIRFSGDAWKWCRPGSRLATDAWPSAAMVQETHHDLATEVLTAQVGPPRHLGRYDADTLRAWLLGQYIGATPGEVE